jgi:hypothetical protein
MKEKIMSDHEERRTDGYHPEDFIGGVKSEDEEFEDDLTDLIGDIKSSGEKRDFGTGAHRDSNTKILKGRMDLVPGVSMRRFASFLTGFDYNPHSKGPHHSLASYNNAIESLYLWLEGERTKEYDGGYFEFDHLSNVLLSCQEIMHHDSDTLLWAPSVSPDYNDCFGLRYDRISPLFLRRVSIHYQKGGLNYGDRNWELGMPAMVTWDCAERHMNNWLEKVSEDEEDHMGAVGWNIMCTMHTIEMVRRGILGEDMFMPPMHRNIQKGTPHSENGFPREIGR